MYAGGQFLIAGSINVHGIAKWDGVNWNAVGSGVQTGGSVNALLKYHQILLAIGDFQVGFSPFIAKWTNTAWEEFYGAEIFPYDISVFNNELYGGGGFDTSSLGVPLHYIARLAIAETDSENATCFTSCNGSATATSPIGIEPDTYSWSNGNTTQSINNLCVGTYTVTVTDSTGSNSFGTVTVTSPPAIVITDTSTNASCPTCTNGSATINNTTGGTPPYNYFWSNGATINSIDSLLQGTYTITVTDGNGCVMVDSVTVGFDVGISEQLSMNSKQLTIFPNPAESQLAVYSEQLAGSTIEIIDLTGREMLRLPRTDYSTRNNRVVVDVSSLPSGIYFLKVTDAQGSVTVKKVVKE